ncbi:MAG: LytR C-terminal domain-containing protein [Gemmatimonadota bacterium]
MKLRLLGFGLTVISVAVLLISLVTGVRTGGAGDDAEVLVRPGVATVDERIRVEVLNGAGIAGLARSVTESLRADGFDVVYYGNAGSLARDSTTILDRSGNEEAIDAVARALEIDRVETAIDTTLYLEATIVLGSDWEAGGRERGNRE